MFQGRWQFWITQLSFQILNNSKFSQDQNIKPRVRKHFISFNLQESDEQLSNANVNANNLKFTRETTLKNYFSMSHKNYWYIL